MINEDLDLPDMTVSTPKGLMLNLGFKFERTQRRAILNDINFEEQKKKIFYLDEIWCNSGHTAKKAWTSNYIKLAKLQALRKLLEEEGGILLSSLAVRKVF